MKYILYIIFEYFQLLLKISSLNFFLLLISCWFQKYLSSQNCTHKKHQELHFFIQNYTHINRHLIILKSTEIRLHLPFFRLTQNQMEFRLVLSQSENYDYNLISVDISEVGVWKKTKTFISVIKISFFYKRFSRFSVTLLFFEDKNNER